MERITATLRTHQPAIDWAYEEFNCSCGWPEPTALGARKIKDGSHNWRQHLRKQLAIVVRETP